MKRLLPAACLALVSLSAACGDASVDQQIADLQAAYDDKQYEVVTTEAVPLIARCKSEGVADNQLWRIEKLRLQATAMQGLGSDAVTLLEQLDKDYPGKVNVKLYTQIGDLIIRAENYTEAIAVLDAGKKKYPDLGDVFDPYIEQVKKKAEASGDDAALAALKALGYV